MANNTSFDAFTLWKNLYDQTENAWRDVIEQTLEQKSFAEGLGQVQDQYLQMQGVINGMTESYLKQMNMPTRDEIAQVATLIINVDAKVDDLDDSLDASTADYRKELDTLKRTVTRLDKKLDTVITLLNTAAEAQKQAPTPASNNSTSQAVQTAVPKKPTAPQAGTK